MQLEEYTSHVTGRRARPLLGPFRSTLSVAALLVIFLAAGGLGYKAYLATPELVSATPLPARHPAIARRAILFVIDAFHPARAFDPTVMPTVARLAAAGGSGVAHTAGTTTTAPCVFSLTTGRPGSLVQAIFNFHADETRVDSVLSLVATSGKRVVVSGDPAWHHQFDWMVPPEDRYESPEPGITTDPAVRAEDTRAVEFLLGKMQDPAYGLFIVHVGSADAAGHKVTPYGPEYYEVLAYLDKLVARVADVAGPDTVLIVTGDHGMAARGTHGGEEEAKLTPYVLVGPSIRPGVRVDVPQTAFSATLSALLGLPFLPVSQAPPLLALLDLPADAVRGLEGEYFEGKRAAARALAGDSPRVARADNETLDDILFGAEDQRVGLRLLAALVTLLGVLIAARLAWRTSAPAERTPAVGHALLAVGVPVLLAGGATALIRFRALLVYESESIAFAIAGILLVAMVVAAAVAVSSVGLRTRVLRWRLSLYFPVLVVLSIPVVNSHWLRPDGYFAALLVAGAVGLATVVWGGGRTLRGSLLLPFAALVLVSSPRLSEVVQSAAVALPLASAVVIGGCAVALRGGRVGRTVCEALGVVAIFATAWLWRSQPGTGTASIVLALFTALIGLAATAHDPGRAAALIVGAATGLFLVLAADAREAFVFQLAALGALLAARWMVDLRRPEVIYLVAGIAILVRVVLFFALGDQYNISSIRTAPGFVLVNQGLPLPTVAGILLLKYALPWLLVLAGLLPSLVRAGRTMTTHVLDLLVLGYVARFALVAAVIDPCRILPNGMNGIVGMFCVSWAELMTFGIAATLGATVLVGVGRSGLPDSAQST